uniref:Intergrase n=1 Tax=Corynephage phi16 TaxID=89551 RepID=Q9ZWV9_9VIRU|nr:intergrase [Corynephage phi16]
MGVQRRPKKGSAQDKGQKPRWVGRYRDHSGKEYSKTFHTEKEAKSVGLVKKSGHYAMDSMGQPRGGAGTALLDLAKEWKDEATKPNTIANRKALVDNLGKLGGIPLNKIIPGDISAWNRTLLEGRPWKDGKPMSSSTVAVMTGQVAGLLNRAHQDRILTHIPRISAPKAPPKMAVSRQDLATPQELAQILDLAHEGKKRKTGAPTPPRIWLEHMIQVALGTGMRVSEIGALFPEDLDVLKLQLSVVRQVLPGGRKTGPLKTERPRTIPIPKSVSDILESRIKDLNVGPGEPIFPYTGESKFEDRIYHDRNSTGRTLARIIEVLEMREITFHDFRHYYASVLIAEGAAVADVQEALGHANASTTLNTYSTFSATTMSARASRKFCVDYVRAARSGKSPLVKLVINSTRSVEPGHRLS